jgi:hypothetical protein
MQQCASTCFTSAVQSVDTTYCAVVSTVPSGLLCSYPQDLQSEPVCTTSIVLNTKQVTGMLRVARTTRSHGARFDAYEYLQLELCQFESLHDLS